MADQQESSGGFLSGIMERLPQKVQDRPGPFFMRVVQFLISMIVFAAISDKVAPDDDRCYYGIETDELKGDPDACSFAVAIGSMGFVFAFIIIFMTLVPWNVPNWMYFGECASSGLMAFFWFVSGIYLADKMETTCSTLTCADPCKSDVCNLVPEFDGYDKASYDNAQTGVLFSWLSLFLWGISAHWAFHHYTGPKEDGAEESWLQSALARCHEIIKMLIPEKLRSYPAPWVLRWIEFFCAMIVFAAVVDKGYSDISGETYCFFGIENGDSNVGTCDFAVGYGVYAWICTIISVAVLFFMEGNNLTRMGQLALDVLNTFMWFVLACLLANDIRTTCANTTCADIGTEDYDREAYNNAEAAVLFSWVCFFLWVSSSYHSYKIWQVGGLPEESKETTGAAGAAGGQESVYPSSMPRSDQYGGEAGVAAPATPPPAAV